MKDIPALTGLRGIAAGAVVISHAIPQILKFYDPLAEHPVPAPLPVLLLSQASGFGMSLFFVLSGFVIYLNYWNRIWSRVGFYNFIVARFARLYPLFAVCILFEISVLVSIDMVPPQLWKSALFYATMTQSWFYKVIEGHSLIHQYRAIGGVSWSISTEWAFYFFFPGACIALAWLRTARQKIVFTIVYALAGWVLFYRLNMLAPHVDAFGLSRFGIVASDPQEGFSRWLTYFSPYVRVSEFILGCLCASIYLSLPPVRETEEKLGLWITIAGFVGALVFHCAIFGLHSGNVYFQLAIQMHKNFGFAPFCALAIFGCARYNNHIVRAISSKWIVKTGEISYSLYLVHLIIIGAFRFEVPPITTWVGAIGNYARLGVVLASTVGLSLMTWTFIEMPARKFIRRWLQITEAHQQDASPTVVAIGKAG